MEQPIDQSLKAKLQRRFVRHGNEALNLLNPVKNLRSLAYQLYLYRLAGKRLNGVHLGCGWSIIKGFLNVDASLIVPCDVVGRVDRLKLSADCAATIYCSHTLEHVPRARIRRTIEEWHRVLQPGGRIYLLVPDVQALWRIYLEKLADYDNPESRRLADFACDITYGGQSTKYDFHFYGYSFPTLKALLESVGFKEVARFERASVDFAPFRDAGYSKVGDEPISLNITALK